MLYVTPTAVAFKFALLKVKGTVDSGVHFQEHFNDDRGALLFRILEISQII